MRLLSRFWIGVASALICAAGAQAADMPGMPPPLPAPPPPSPWVSTGWYVRGDIGGYFGTVGHVVAPSGFPTPHDDKLGSGFTGGGGFGIKTPYLRTDVTIDYASPASYSGTAAGGSVKAKIQPTTALFNGYFDLVTWRGFTPYVGAGAGTALVNVSDYRSTVVPPFGGDTSRTQWTFAYAGMAGVGWTISPGLILDVGYRYLNVGNVRTAQGVGGETTFKNVAAHEVRVGVRWSLDELQLFH